MTAYPQIIDYNEAVQNPTSAFTDSLLRAGQVATNGLGLPHALSGGFALTYRVDTSRGPFAVRCFHRLVPELEEHYGHVSRFLANLRNQHFIEFEYQPRGVSIQSGQAKGQYPIVRMEWVQGATLGMYVDKYAHERQRMLGLADAFRRLSELFESRGFAHGDLQNGNVIVRDDGKLTLIDYDGMWVPTMPRGRGSEVGHKHFQHPDRTANDFGPTVDRFSLIAIHLSLLAIAEAPELHQLYREGGETLIFKALDFIDPSQSSVFQRLGTLPSVAGSVATFARLCRSPIDSMPPLADFIDRRLSIVSAPPPQPSVGLGVGVPQTYVGPYAVIDARDFNAVLARVGQRVELIGKIVTVKEGTTRRGRGGRRGQPYIFVNFGKWNEQSAKLTIWSETISRMSNDQRPSQNWEGKWLSVTGLIDPPYSGNFYGRPFVNVGPTLDSTSALMP